MSWRDDLYRLHAQGWSADDIDDACEALHEACTDGALKDSLVTELTAGQIRSELGITVDDALAASLRRIAALRSRRDADTEHLRHAMYDLDAFAYEFAGDD